MIKKAISAVVILLVVTIYVWYEYKWAERVLSNHKDPWTLVYQQKADWQFLKPWTWVKRPINTILLVEKGAYGKLNRQLYFAHTLILRKGEETINSIDIIDMGNAKYSSCNSFEEYKALDDEKIKNLFWVKIEKSSLIFDLSEFLARNVKTYLAIDPLGDERDVSNYIASGQYEIKDGYKNYVYEFINKQPFSIATKDLPLIELAFDKWKNENREYKVYNRKLQLTDIHYSYSTVIYTMTDIFSFDVKANKNTKDTILNIEFTFLKLYYPENKSENEVMILQ